MHSHDVENVVRSRRFVRLPHPLPAPAALISASCGLALAVVAFGLVGQANAVPVDAVQLDGPCWTELASDRPLAAHDTIQDVEVGRMILHGGVRDGTGKPPLAIRQLDLTVAGGEWSDAPLTGVGPRPRLERGLQGSRAVVDPGEQIALVVCDCRNGSTHLLDLAENRWSRAPSDRVISVWDYLLTYDPATDRALLFGGDERGDDEITDRAWAYDLSPARRGWRSLPRVPFRALHQAAGYDTVSGHFLVFGGLDPRLNEIEKLWRLDVARADEADAWRDITPLIEGEAPSPRGGATLTFVGETSMAVLYGGYSNGGDHDDAWLLDYTDPEAPRWVPLEVEGPHPGTRSGHTATWDATNDRLVVYGGVRGWSFLEDTWALDPALGEDPTLEATTPPPTSTATPSATPTVAPSATPTCSYGIRLYAPIVYLPAIDES